MTSASAVRTEAGAIPLRVLLVEDDGIDAGLILRQLRSAGYEPDAHRVETEEEYLAALDPAPDLILSDFRLPRFSGLRALELRCERTPEVPFVIVSGTIEGEFAVDLVRRGATDYVLKDRLVRLGPLLARIFQEQRLRREKEAAEAQLRRSEEYHRFLIETSLDNMIVLDADGTRRYASSAVEPMLGYRPEEVVGRAAFELAHPEDLPKLREAWAHVLQNPAVLVRVEYRARHKDGSWRELEATARNLLAEPAVKGVVVSARDVTERRRAERALETSEKRFRKIFESSLDGIAINRHPDGAYLDVNDEWVALTGYSRAEALGKTPAELGIWVDRRDLSAVVERLRSQGLMRNYEARIRRRDGTILWMTFSAVRTELDGEPCILSFSRSIDDLKRTQEELAAARDQALEASRLKSAFLANVSHEIRTPLNVILGYNTLVADYLADLGDESQQPLFETIGRASRRLIRTVHGILDLSKIESRSFALARTAVRVRPVLERLVRDYDRVAREKGVELHCVVEDADPVVAFDEYCLTQALTNLVDNAVKFTERGSVTVKVRDGGNGRVCIEVSDTGVGIAPDYLARLFEPFSQEDASYTRRYEGNGLGLALTRQYVELNGGKISVESEKGRGSTFRIELPRAQAAPATAPAPVEARIAPVKPAPTRARILVVEDDPDTQTYMQILLGSRYEVSLAATAAEAREALWLHGDAIRVILADISLKGSEDGLALTRLLRADRRWKDVPVVAVTAHAGPHDRTNALSAGCDAYLPKPFDCDTLFTLIEQLIARPARPVAEGQLAR